MAKKNCWLLVAREQRGDRRELETRHNSGLLPPARPHRLLTTTSDDALCWDRSTDHVVVPVLHPSPRLICE